MRMITKRRIGQWGGWFASKNDNEQLMTDSTEIARLPLAKVAQATGGDVARAPFAEVAFPCIPDYMKETYDWAYINPRNVALLDNNLVVWTILWGNRKKLMRISHSEFRPGQKVLQAAHVYGSFTVDLARLVGPEGQIDVIDIVPIQVEHGRRKLAGMPQAHVRLADAASPGGGPYDGVSSYFLLHEMPDNYKYAVVNALLDCVAPGGKAVFVDYHKPHRFHPLRKLMYFIFNWLEPYAFGLLENEIESFAREAEAFTWRKETYFGGLYQKVVAERKDGGK